MSYPRSKLCRYRQSHNKTDFNSSYVRMEKLDKYHGQASGIFACDEHLAGRMPSRGMPPSHSCCGFHLFFFPQARSFVQWWRACSRMKSSSRSRETPSLVGHVLCHRGSDTRFILTELLTKFNATIIVNCKFCCNFLIVILN